VRLAVNLSGISRGDAERGETLTISGWLRPTRRLDARLKMVAGAPHALRHNTGVTFHLFTSETNARIRLLDADRLDPGAEGWVQILLSEPLPMVKGDYFVVRSAEDTLGGGQVVDASPRRRHRRFNPDVVEQLMMLDQGTGEDILLSVAEQYGPCDLTTLSQRSNLPADEVAQRSLQLANEGHMVVLGELGAEADAVVFSAQSWNILKSKIFVALQTYHNQFPLRRGVPVQEVRSRLGLSQPVSQRVLARLTGEDYLVEEGPYLRLPDHQVTLSDDMEANASAYLKALEQEPYSPPSDRPVDAELLAVLVERGQVVKVNESVVFASSAYREMSEKIVDHLKSQGTITVGEARTMFNTSRKYILPLLEHLDRQQITRRVGDERVLR